MRSHFQGDNYDYSADSGAECRNHERCRSESYGKRCQIGADGLCSACVFDAQFLALIRELPLRDDVPEPRRSMIEDLLAELEHCGPQVVESMWEKDPHRYTSTDLSFEDAAMGIGSMPKRDEATDYFSYVRGHK